MAYVLLYILSQHHQLDFLQVYQLVVMKEAIKILEKDRTSLISSFMKGEELGFFRRYSNILDNYFHRSFEESPVGSAMDIRKNPYAIVALGGYGRGEMCIHSDLDILLLFDKRVPKEAKALIRDIIYPLWDIGFDVSCATRSIKECITLALRNNQVLTSFLDARFICGQSALYTSFTRRMKTKITPQRAKKIVSALVKDSMIRHARYGDSSFLLEPNLKEGRGGLRDYHTILWLARLRSEIKRSKDLKFLGYLSYAGYETLKTDLSFIWKIRNHLHCMAGRRCDQLYFEYQTKLADILHYDSSNGQFPVEKFLGDLHGHMESLKNIYMTFVVEHGYYRKKRSLKKLSQQSHVRGIKVKEGMLTFSSSEDIAKSPSLLMKIFEESLRLKMPLSSEAKLLIRDMAYLFDEKLRTSVSTVKTFEDILRASETRHSVLTEMLSSGFLQQLIPQYKLITNRIQHDHYHIHPVDKHCLLTVKAIKEFGRISDDPRTRLCHQLYRGLKKKKLLLWAALLHDIGKGEKGQNHSDRGAVIAERILREFHFKNSDIETVTFLIKEHLTLAKIAARRDINDEETAIRLARKVMQIGRLKMLYLLTVADSIATGPAAWNDWTAALMQNLFIKVLHILEGGELASGKAVNGVAQKKQDVLAVFEDKEEKEEVKKIFNFMSPRYLLYTSAHDIIRHIHLYRSMKDAPVAWEVTESPESNTRVVTICAYDQPGLFSKIAGTFTLNHIDILESQIYTWRNNIALDVFKVKPPLDLIREDEKWRKTKQCLLSAISGKIDPGVILEKKSSHVSLDSSFYKRPSKVNVDNESSSFFTIIEVITYDFPGLLFSVTNALFECHLDIWVAKIATKVDQVVDVFYVRDFDGQKVDDPNQIEKIRTAILSVLTI